MDPTARTLTRTKDFVMVPSEVMLGPGGEKVNAESKGFFSIDWCL